MTKFTALFSLLPALLALADAPTLPDPTAVPEAMGGLIQKQLAEFRSVEIPALVCAQPTNGIALITTKDDATLRVVRRGSQATLHAAGLPFPVEVTEVSAQGVSVKASTLGGEWTISTAFAHSGLAPAPATGREGALACVEFDGVPLKAALRLLSDQSGRNFVATEAASQKRISLFLRNVSVDTALNELCKSHELWNRSSPDDEVVRILTAEEFRENLTSFQQEEQCETFTLLYPNVAEVASIIQGIYADRVCLSLGDQDILDDELDDISRRFEKFQAISDTGSSTDLMGNFNSINTRNRSIGGYGRGRGGIYSSRNGWLDVVTRNAEERPAQRTYRQIRAEDYNHVQQLLGATNTMFIANGLAKYSGSTPSIFVTISRRSNILVVRTADPRVMDEIRSLVKRIDVPTPMVLLEIEVMELELDDGLNSVFDYSIDGVNIGGKHDWSISGATALSALAAPQSITFATLSEHFEEHIKLQRTRGKVKTLATPTLLTAHNEVSQLFIGEEIPITKNVTSTTIVTDEGNTVSTPQTETEWVKVGTRLLITPNINVDRTVTLQLIQENSERNEGGGNIMVVNTKTGETEKYDVDTVNCRSVAGTFVAQDQMTIVAGGLITETQKDAEDGIPVLMDIPVLGWLFRSTEKVRARNELVVYIKPHVLMTPGEAAHVNQAFTDDKVRNPLADALRSRKGLEKEKRDREEARIQQQTPTLIPDEADSFYIK